MNINWRVAILTIEELKKDEVPLADIRSEDCTIFEAAIVEITPHAMDRGHTCKQSYPLRSRQICSLNPSDDQYHEAD